MNKKSVSILLCIVLNILMISACKSGVISQPSAEITESSNYISEYYSDIDNEKQSKTDSVAETNSESISPSESTGLKLTPTTKPNLPTPTVKPVLTPVGKPSLSPTFIPDETISDIATDKDFHKFIESKNANSGLKGNLYYIHLNDILNQFGSNTVTKYDFVRFAASLQGLLNRDKPKVFIEQIKISDIFWYNYLRQDDKLLYGYKKIDIKTVDEFFSVFGNDIKRLGLVLWDEKVNSTANVATTVCGVEGYLPVRNLKTSGSLYDLIIKKVNGVKVELDLSNLFTGEGIIPGTSRSSSGSAKNDAYIWAMEKYIAHVSDELLAQVPDAIFWNETGDKYPDIPNSGMVNLDYYTANKVFLFDLSPWGDETPSDDKTQPLGTDLRTLKELLQRTYDKSGGTKMISVSGFVPWHLKYTTYKNLGKHGEVATEWRSAQIFSAYNAFKDADAINYMSLANASIYQKYEIQDVLKNNRPKEIQAYDSTKKYVLFYMGDYDSASWMARFVPTLWRDRRIGEIPLAWPFNPNLSARIPMVFEYVYKYRTDNDYFVTGNSGAGYINPNYLIEPRIHSNNPSGMNTWIEHNKKYLSKLDIDITGFVLNSAQPLKPEVLDAYAQMTPKGVITHNYLFGGLIHKGTPFISMTTDDAGAQNQDLHGVTNNVMNHISINRSRTNFFVFRSVLCSPTYLASLAQNMKNIDPDIEIVDPYTFFELLKMKIS